MVLVRDGSRLFNNMGIRAMVMLKLASSCRAKFFRLPSMGQNQPEVDQSSEREHRRNPASQCEASDKDQMLAGDLHVPNQAVWCW